jgi:hypothetical protein
LVQVYAFGTLAHFGKSLVPKRVAPLSRSHNPLSIQPGLEHLEPAFDPAWPRRRNRATLAAKMH